MSDRLQLDGVDLVFDDGSARSVDLILVPCPTCDGSAGDHWLCSECGDSGWILIPGAPISLEDLERMAPWADKPDGRPPRVARLTACTDIG